MVCFSWVAHLSSSDTKSRVIRERDGVGVPQLPAHNVGIGHAPVVMTHGPPHSVIVHLHSALSRPQAIHNTHQGMGRWRGVMRVIKIQRNQDLNQNGKI